MRLTLNLAPPETGLRRAVPLDRQPLERQPLGSVAAGSSAD